MRFEFDDFVFSFLTNHYTFPHVLRLENTSCTCQSDEPYSSGAEDPVIFRIAQISQKIRNPKMNSNV